MSGPKQTLWAIEPHTQAKHEILQRYLHAWLPIISAYNSRVVFIDGFAGPGEYSGGEEGSPILAMRALIEHAHAHAIRSTVSFIFFESDAKRAAHLEGAISPFRAKLPSGSTASVHHGEFSPLLTGVLDQIGVSGRQLAPSLVFIDPFGVSGVPMELVRRVMATPSCEVLINFMVGYAHRFITAPEFEPHLNIIFGTHSWLDGRSMNGHERVDFLRRMYLHELQRKDVGGSARYARAFSMLDRKNQPIYDLVFATNHPVGIDRMKDALWKIDKNGGGRYSDATDPGQATLLDATVSHDAALIAMLKAEFAGQTVDWSCVEERIRQSPFRILKTPLTQAARDPKSGITISPTVRPINGGSRFKFS